MNLTNYGVQELNAQEIKETDGGFPFLIILGIALLVSSCAPGCAAAKAIYEE